MLLRRITAARSSLSTSSTRSVLTACVPSFRSEALQPRPCAKILRGTISTTYCETNSTAKPGATVWPRSIAFGTASRPGYRRERFASTRCSHADSITTPAPFTNLSQTASAARLPAVAGTTISLACSSRTRYRSVAARSASNAFSCWSRSAWRRPHRRSPTSPSGTRTRPRTHWR